MHRGLGSATRSQLAFPREDNPNFPWEKSHWDNTVVKKVCVFFLREKKSLVRALWNWNGSIWNKAAISPDYENKRSLQQQQQN